jgi:hypothetical protein
VPGPWPAQGARPAADRRDPRPGRDPGAEPAGAGRRDLACGPERTGHGGAGLAARRRSAGLVRALPSPHRGRPAAPGRGGTRGLRPRSGRGRLRAACPPRAAETPEGLRSLPKVEVLRQVWARHFVRQPPEGGVGVRLRGKADPPPSAPAVASPYDTEARLPRRPAFIASGPSSPPPSASTRGAARTTVNDR